MKDIKELIEVLERACDLFDKIQERKAVLEAEEIIKEVGIKEYEG